MAFNLINIKIKFTNMSYDLYPTKYILLCRMMFFAVFGYVYTVNINGNDIRRLMRGQSIHVRSLSVYSDNTICWGEKGKCLRNDCNLKQELNPFNYIFHNFIKTHKLLSIPMLSCIYSGRLRSAWHRPTGNKAQRPQLILLEQDAYNRPFAKYAAELFIIPDLPFHLQFFNFPYNL